MKTSEVAFQIYGCGHALETPYRGLISRLADFSTSLLQFCHTQKSVCFGGVEPHVRVMPVQTFFDYTDPSARVRGS